MILNGKLDDAAFQVVKWPAVIVEATQVQWLSPYEVDSSNKQLRELCLWWPDECKSNSHYPASSVLVSTTEASMWPLALIGFTIKYCTFYRLFANF